MKNLLPFLRKSSLVRTAVIAVLMPGMALFPTLTYGNPTGGVVVHGGVEIGEGLHGHLSILQSTDKAIINWQDFSIQAGEVTEFIQPGSGSAVLNRVVSGNPSAIHGALKANGNVFVINPNGILVGPSGRIDVGGLVLSTLDISDADFLDGGDNLFKGNSNAGVTNHGRINAIGGDVFLIGKKIVNTGTIDAPEGLVGLGAGSEVLIAANPDANGERVFVQAGKSGAMIDNSGSIAAAAVELKAHGNPYALAINNSGSIRATGVNRSGGSVFLRATGGQINNTGTIEATLPGGNGGRILIEAAVANIGGTVDASGTGDGDGGEITILGEEINVTGNVLANGKNGGTIQVGGLDGEQRASSVTVGSGAVISANGTSGDGGLVTITGDVVSTMENSLISATGSVNGGDVRLTGFDSANIGGRIDVSGVSGVGGGAIVETSGALLMAPGSEINANGGAGGGQVNVGGGFQGRDDSILNAKTNFVWGGSKVSVDAINFGNAGTAIFWADGNTLYRGEVSAQALGAVGNGGFVEISGKRHLAFEGSANLLAAGEGGNGTLLLDPANTEITNGAAQEDPTASVITRGQINAQLALGHVVIATTVADALEDGNVLISDRVDFSQPNNLAILATGDIVFRSATGNQSRLRNTHGTSGDITLVAGWDGVTGAPSPGNSVNANGMFRPENPGAAPFEGNAASYG
ncbi:MAG: filamentous hemagglutinin N-terminal domain-containing protein, partial [Verrucomicrobiales bacterium]|nr:filamentous hemagglutinin N-terminal domain-containing protein [Verrucomicrobiales bacterium]